MNSKNRLPGPDAREPALAKLRNLKMARSSHAYVRGNTAKFYQWLEGLRDDALPAGPPIWICGDCHTGNLGPLANAAGRVEIQIRDLDQTVIGNPALDLIRLGLSLASAARGSDLPGVTTARLLGELAAAYEAQFEHPVKEESGSVQPKSIAEVTAEAARATWNTLSIECIDGEASRIDLGKRFWPLSEEERLTLRDLFASDAMRELATALRSRRDGAKVKLLDAAYWVKGCSSLGRLRYAALLQIKGESRKDDEYCLMDIKEAVKPLAPRVTGQPMPSEPDARIVEGARHLSPYLGKRMRAVRAMGRSFFVREIRPQDLKVEIERMTRDEALEVARYLAGIVGKAHNRQMDDAVRRYWRSELRRRRSQPGDAPDWLWASVVDLLIDHERAYLEHCRRYASKGT